ncbi:carboxylesterase family protein-like protein [Byssothecium circinans]|uniref:Carboxylic ester hydrolase n=1 Tax=Byssothecium circinans TaxID=147558 RepID=A0A6A5TWS7_9PLEO|nr:carboxylesterase family protein-like protein [Byssothecium circinans]
MLRLLSTVAAAAALVSAQGSSGNAILPMVDLGYELYRASNFNDTGRFYNFSNIRFARPVVGELRFAPPSPPEENRTVIRNGDVGRICPQASPSWEARATNVLIDLALGREPNSTTPYVPPGANSSSVVPTPDPRENEDCLFLDVFVPEQIFERRTTGSNNVTNGSAVLVWIHGGGYVRGSKYNNPAGLLAASGNSSFGEVIYVSINYRLGALGWMGGPGYQAEGGVSNVALYDQRFALEWVQNYIHIFGGDKDRVTIFGESAGGGSIMHQITAYGGAKGPVPFQQAVPQSPGWQPFSSQFKQEDTYRRFLNLTNSTSLVDLRALPSEVVVRTNAQQIAYDTAWASYIYGPVVDGNFVPLQPGQLLAQGRFAKDVKVMVGHNAHEGAFFTPPYVTSNEALEAQISSSFANIPQSSLRYIADALYPPVFDGSYGYTSQFARADLITSEAVFTCNTNYLSTAFNNKTYSYLFAVPPAFHGQDIAYTYYDGGALSSTPFGVYNRTVAIALQEFITSFAMNGVPQAEGIRQFNMYGPDARVLELNVTGIEEVRDSNSGARCSWWQLGLYS